jgi:putative IMPACT (imprinted ancient) family translation regulator
MCGPFKIKKIFVRKKYFIKLGKLSRTGNHCCNDRNSNFKEEKDESIFCKMCENVKIKRLDRKVVEKLNSANDKHVHICVVFLMVGGLLPQLLLFQPTLKIN